METQTLESINMDVKKVDKKNSSRTELIKREEIKDSPFTIISVKDKHFGVMGNYRVTEENHNKKEVKKELEKITWNRIIQVMMILNTMQEETNKTINNKENKN